jgi:putative transposase
VALFLDATYLAVRHDGPKEGVLVAWGFTEQGERVLLSVMLGYEDWLELGRDLIARGLGAPLLIVADGAPGLVKAIEQCWPASDRQRCCVHRARNLYAKLPERERERVKQAYWQALDEAINEQDAKQRLEALVGQLDKGGYTAAAKCLADDLDALVVHLRYPTTHRRRWRSTDESVKPLAARSARFRATVRSRWCPRGPEIGSCGLVLAGGARIGRFQGVGPLSSRQRRVLCWPCPRR